MKSIRRRDPVSGVILYLKVSIDPCKGGENRSYGRLDLAPINPIRVFEIEESTCLLFDVKGTIARADEEELEECCFRFNRTHHEEDPFTPPIIGSPLWVGNEYYTIEKDTNQTCEEVLLRLIIMRVLLYSLANYQMQQVGRAVLHTKQLRVPILSSISGNFYRRPHRDHDPTQASWSVALPEISYAQLAEALAHL
jgi:hypothetical protein